MLTKNIYLSVEIEDVDEPELLAEILAERLFEKTDFLIKSVQYRYGAFGRVDKIYANEVLSTE